jgi:hypothetical protein
MTDWSTIFTESRPNPPLSADELRREISLLSAPLSPTELQELAKTVRSTTGLRTENPVARFGVPEALLDLYRWCDGGDFLIGEREFAPILRFGEIREYLVTYGVIHWTPGCIPIGMDGGACFYLLDLASPSLAVRFAGMNELDGVAPLADSFGALFTDRRRAASVAGL